MKKISILLFFVSIFLLVTPNQSFALKQQADTTTTTVPDDLDFTTVGSAEDSLANNLEADTTTTAVETTATPPNISKTEVPKTLWQTFIEGLLGGFLAFLMPCIFFVLENS